MHPEIEKLIDLALADGQITEKERNVILKKAAELGVDADEVEMTLDGKLHQLEASKPKQKEKAGNIKTCPACGSSVKAFQIKCDDCGHEFRQTQSSINIKELHNKIINASIKDKATIIQSFPIPTNKEDIIEFLTLSIPNATPMINEEKNGYLTWKGINVELSYREAEIAAWANKSNIVIAQAKILFADDSLMREILKNYEVQLNRNTQKEGKKRKNNELKALIVFILFCVLIGYFTSSSNISIEKENNRLNKLYNNVSDKILSKNYDAAKLLINQMHWEYNDSWQGSKSDDMAKKWDEKREKLNSEIEKTKMNR